MATRIDGVHMRQKLAKMRPTKCSAVASTRRGDAALPRQERGSVAAPQKLEGPRGEEKG